MDRYPNIALCHTHSRSLLRMRRHLMLHVHVSGMFYVRVKFCLTLTF